MQGPVAPSAQVAQVGQGFELAFRALNQVIRARYPTPVASLGVYVAIAGVLGFIWWLLTNPPPLSS